MPSISEDGNQMRLLAHERQLLPITTKGMDFDCRKSTMSLRMSRQKARYPFADLIKLGAGIADSEIKAKLAETSNLKTKLTELRVAVQTEKKRLAEITQKERQEQFASLELEPKRIMGKKIYFVTGVTIRPFVKWNGSLLMIFKIFSTTTAKLSRFIYLFYLCPE